MANLNLFAQLPDEVDAPSPDIGNESEPSSMRDNKPKKLSKASASEAAKQTSASAGKSKEKGWQAGLTLAQIKAMKLKESEEKHMKNHPLRPAVMPAKAAATKGNNGGKPRPEPQTPCGLRDCPVKDDHEGRPYGSGDLLLPNLIKKIKVSTLRRFLFCFMV